MLRFTLIVAVMFYFLLQSANASLYSNCLVCHDSHGLLGGKFQIDGNAFSQSVHAKMNPRMNLSSSACWACHDSDGIVIVEEDYMGDRYKNPYNCTSCHLPGEEKEGAYGAPLVYNHFAGGELRVGFKNISSCISCHEIQGMVFPNSDIDTGTFAGDKERKNGGNLSFYHYGKKREDLEIGTTEYCKYCHSKPSEFSIVFQKKDNQNIVNHSLKYPSPTCSECHGNGSLHSSNLIKPIISDYLCLACHAKEGITGTKLKHNGTINCTTCHSKIHPVTYLQENLTYGFNPVNCAICHEQGLLQAPKIPSLQHSNNPANGSVFGNYWLTKVEACYYCHGNTLHEDKAFGKIVNILSRRNKTDFNTYWCSNCHYNFTPKGEYFYNGTAYVPTPPEITNPLFFNHSRLIISDWSDKVCKECHGILVKNTVDFVHNVSQGQGGPDCAACHDLKGIAAKKINFSAFKESVHRNLNSYATNNTSLSEIASKACWACHGNGEEPKGHPQRYKNPLNCNNNDCHSLSQSFKAPMIYSHFKDADLNSNPYNALNYNVSTNASCETCHSNSLSAISTNLNASVSHYSSTMDLIDSINCIYCHLDKENAIKWGNTIEINKNRTSLIEMNREKNRIVARVGEFTELGSGYRVKVDAISIERRSAAIELYKNNIPVDKALANIGTYTYEEERIINNASYRIPVIVLNITHMFLKDNESFMQFEGLRIKRAHYENKTTSCYLCHFYGSSEKHKYIVIDRKNDYIYFTEVLFNSSDKKEYDQEHALEILANKTPDDAYTNIERGKRKTLQKEKRWELSGNYSLTLKDIAENSDSAQFLLEIGGKSYSEVGKRGKVLEFVSSINYLGYQLTNITIFRADVSEILQPSIVVLEDIVALSPEIKKIKDNTTISGYNTSWLWQNNTFLLGRIPASFHSPLLNDGINGGADCLSCHGAEGLQKRITSLGRHETLNGGGNKACYACHGGSEGIRTHPANYKNPRNCNGCHASIENNYSAVYIGDEEHKNERCEACHVSNFHDITIFKLGLLPAIINLSLLKEGNKTIVKALAVAGYKMKVRDARYYIDSPEEKFKMYPVDGAFDYQREVIIAEINISNLSPGKHAIYVEAMERNNRWGAPASIVFTVEGVMKDNKKLSLGMFSLAGIIAAFVVRFLLRACR